MDSGKTGTAYIQVNELRLNLQYMDALSLLNPRYVSKKVIS